MCKTRKKGFLSSVKKSDGTFTTSASETLDLLLNFFPDSVHPPINSSWFHLGNPQRADSACSVTGNSSKVNLDSLKVLVNSFSPYKAPGNESFSPIVV